jgi:hypothetical protein
MTEEQAQPGDANVEAHCGRRARCCPFARLWRPIQWTVNLLLVLVLLYTFTPLGGWFGHWLTHVDELAKADYIVVLGGDPARAVEAARLYRDGWAPKVIVTSKGEWADQIAEVASAYGVPDSDLIVDRAATRTHDHPRTVADLPGVARDQRFILVTTRLHTYRARLCFLHDDYQNLVMRCPDWRAGRPYGPERAHWSSRVHQLRYKLREMAAVVYYRLRGWL